MLRVVFNLIIHFYILFSFKLTEKEVMNLGKMAICNHS